MSRLVSVLLAISMAACAPAPEAPEPAGSKSEPPAKQVPGIVREMIEAHGGMEPWNAAPSVRFTIEFREPGAESGLVTTVAVETGRRRASIEVPGSDMRMAWDGEKAWGLNWSLPVPPRFLALLQYYFVALPWLTMDPGVRLAEEAPRGLPEDATEYRTVRMTFDPGAGDTPDDYYVLLIHPETRRLKACEYIVTYRALLPEGVAATPPHTLIFDDFASVDGLLVPTAYHIIDNATGAPYGSAVITSWSFREPFDASRVDMPEGAVVDTSTP